MENIFNRTLQHYIATYAGSTDPNVESDAFTQLRLTVRDMESRKILKPIIFYQMMMTIQALKSVAGLRFAENKVKNIMAIIYPDEFYVTDLTRQIMEAIQGADNIARENPANAPVIDQLRAYVNRPTGNVNIVQAQSRHLGPPPGAFA